MKITVRRLKLAWKYRRYRNVWRHRYDIAAVLATAGVAAGILFLPKRIVKASDTAH